MLECQLSHILREGSCQVYMPYVSVQGRQTLAPRSGEEEEAVVGHKEGERRGGEKSFGNAVGEGGAVHGTGAAAKLIQDDEGVG